MSSSPIAGHSNPRIATVVAALSQYDVGQLAGLIARRLEGAAIPELPGLGREEEPRAIFVEVAKHANEGMAERLRKAVADLLSRMSTQPKLESASVIGEVCYLSAALGVSDAVIPLAKLVSRDDASSVHLKDCEELRLRALRSLVGLLGWHRPAHPDSNLKQLFESLLQDPKYELLCLTALVGLWPEHKTHFLDQSPDRDTVEPRLNTSLQWAGFCQEAPRV